MTNRVLSFDPDRFISETAAPPRELFVVPAEWKHGLTLLADRHKPKAATPDRWTQIIADATKIATIWGDIAAESGWSIENLFGFDPDGDYGLAVALRGRNLVCIKPEYAACETTDRYHAHYPRLPAGAPLLWNFDERRLGQ